MARSKRLKSKQKAVKVYLARLRAAQAEITDLKGKLRCVTQVAIESEEQYLREIEELRKNGK